MVAYGGDEVSALVLDIGTSTTRAGYAGDDVPKAVFPTTFGYTTHYSGDENKEVRIHLGDEGVSLWRDGMEVGNPLQNGIVYDWTPVPAIINHAINRSLHCDPTEHPVLMTEPAWNTQANRERMAEILFEEFQVPAFYIANNGVLSAFAAGKGTALVIDIGKSVASVVPVSDGFVLRKGIAQSPLPPLAQTTAFTMLANGNANVGRPGASLVPHQLIASKQPVEVNMPPSFTLRPERQQGTAKTWLSWAENREVEEWINGCVGVLDQGWNDQHASMRPPRHYEFPTGFNSVFSSERFIPGEVYFTHHHLGSGSQLPPTLPQLIHACLNATEPDLRPALLNNVVLTGGNSLLPGMADRINNELMRLAGGIQSKLKIHAPGNPTERRFAPWLGGSILASLGTFHQLWISREEWKEHGPNIVAQRCK
ncbi:Actin-related protein 4 OS=Emericella nidulans (strain FGSC A4 / ATCC 38163 / CBS 112,46 / NRRL 194 / M139) GN=arp4 PE=3 SV=1 [Rhizoctonia solani AG-1 IB]|uniref:Actin-related protein 4 n=2 Tax=Thanatephorus cucumeris (strain AG1-IB / isolate 7/3/14) TaxID=1108050 RepID=A0A0B7FPI7_THACB|nr:Actin-related protein 4 OS=Emericella nidulans (strain FGSC A4 / ATCC 38163 / CBS 112,46 / NRRL 194 / M139) GN=arp4 PE=3 SV=1 [Rhizoctonia solani AG-1 IB]